jgi:ketohexokinase/beta-glucosidase
MRSSSTHLTRDQRLQIQTLRDIKWTHKAIATHLNVTERQVEYSLSQEHVTPKKKTGRKSTLSERDVDEIEIFICSSRTGRLMSYLHLATGPFEHFQVGQYAIQLALKKRGYTRHVARAKPPLNAQNRANRLQWAQEHVNWTREQWCLILWSDETWVTGGRHRKQWVTRKAGEELYDTCVLEKIRKRRGWMFWGCFSGEEKGPCLFWEKEWGSINKTSYCEKIVPLVHGWMRMHPLLHFMQDSAPGHAAGSTKDELLERGIYTIFWPAYSPDLNPIETVWNWMKDWIEERYGDIHHTYDKLQVYVKEAWEAITVDQLSSLIDTMRDRCLAVIEAEGGFTKY